MGCFGMSFSLWVDSKHGQKMSDDTELAVTATASVFSMSASMLGS
jgi:hypothetical protein